jgi:ribosomal protein L22
VLYSFVKIVARHKFPAKTAALVAAALLAAMANAQYGGYTERGAPYRLGCLTRPQ